MSVRRAIFQKFILVLALALLLSGSIFGITISNIILNDTRDNMLYTLEIVDHSLDYSKDLNPQVKDLKKIAKDQKTRFTIMDLEGNVLADSDVIDYTSMENHYQREEVQEALESGVGDGRRKSDTIDISMLYVASLSKNKEYIIRMAIPFSGLLQYIGIMLPAILISIGITLIISIILAKRFSSSITKPLNDIEKQLLKFNDIKPELPQFQFREYQYEEMNVIADTITQMSKSIAESMRQIQFEKMIRQEFFSNASHELKTPITSIRGYIELIENDLVTDETMKKDFLSRIKKETGNMTNLINDILMISRLETKEAEVIVSEVRICPLIEEVSSSLEPLCREYQVTLETNCKPLTMNANTQQLKELMSNLITNAIKYNKPGGSVQVTISSEADDIIIIVEDTGVGISKEDQSRVFERFYRVDKGRSKKIGGTGLGLSIVKHVVNYYNGTIDIESELMVGTKFIVRLPIH